MDLILQDSEITFGAEAKTITLGAPYTALSESQILKIVNLTTYETLYNANVLRFPISIAGAVITHTYDNTHHADTDLLQITIDIGVFFLISDNNYSIVTENWNAAAQTVFEIADDTKYEVSGISVDLTGAEAGSTWTFQMHRAFAPAGADYRTAGEAYTKVVGVGGVAVEISNFEHYGYMKLTAQSDDALDDAKALTITYIHKPLE